MVARTQGVAVEVVRGGPTQETEAELTSCQYKERRSEGEKGVKVDSHQHAYLSISSLCHHWFSTFLLISDLQSPHSQQRTSLPV